MAEQRVGLYRDCAKCGRDESVAAALLLLRVRACVRAGGWVGPRSSRQAVQHCTVQ